MLETTVQVYASERCEAFPELVPQHLLTWHLVRALLFGEDRRLGEADDQWHGQGATPKATLLASSELERPQ